MSQPPILLVEDEPSIQTVIRTYLEAAGFRLLIAADGREAIAEWSTGGCDVVFMDVQMPDLDGFDATREIRRLEAGSGVRVPIVLTSRADSLTSRVASVALAMLAS